ncbi:hypothetical protein AVEN_104731-1 [Araneus ventricosus]|uniref:Uncharacterized protein n=1 Tax=Araneus ventricosus TaxID=182803 RepID=A0A4Y2TNQ9_ARAVE|nr:hypothetical protein AVEN_200993-1 [Araneus ventricosus]GBO01702.1 hypothetical protein AVEN_16485-1 [Araneus ventricosus]GBO03043.1 hypothetical protein AVEN_226889-1 [Araneus ventricosus]GBO03051.1 hypothetical protein AVEN_104731-1 [Araneus ventricosus]
MKCCFNHQEKKINPEMMMNFHVLKLPDLEEAFLGSLSVSVCERDNSKTQQARWMKFGYVVIIPKLYRVPTEVPYHPFNYRTAAAIFIRVVSRYGKVTMRYGMKPLTAPPGGNGGVSVIISKPVRDRGKQ